MWCKAPLCLFSTASILFLGSIAAAPCVAQQTVKRSGIESEHFSEQIAPGDDFYRYVNEGWLEATTLPDGRGSLSQANAIAIDTRSTVRAMITASGHPLSAEQGERLQKIAALYSSYMDRETIESLGLEPIRAELDSILAIQTPEDIARWMAHPVSHTIAGAYVWLGLEDTSRHLFTIDQNNTHQRVIGLPSPRYYDEANEQYLEAREGYRAYIALTFENAGIDDAQARAEAVYNFEARLAGVMWSQAQLRDRAANYNPMTLEQLLEYAPGFDWETFLQTRGVPDVDIINVATDTAIQGAARIVSETPVSDVASYLAFHWVDNHAHLLPAQFDDAAFDFKWRELRGVETRSPIENRAINFVIRHYGPEVGREYVSRHFPESSRLEMINLVEYVMAGFETAISQADWLDTPTRARALEKLSLMRVEVGYPTVWEAYDAFQVDPTDPIGNLHRSRALQWRHDLERLGGPYPDGAWFMNAHTVDAAFSPQLNAIYFPAGILQAPIYDPNADAAANFGAIGAIIAHEIGHGFDDQGSRFDGHGVLQNWWTDEARAAFDDKTHALISQFSEYSIDAETALNAEQMAGEIIADLSGVSVAYAAYRRYVDDYYQGQAPVIDGLTGDQRFFMAWAQAFRTVWSDAALRMEMRNSYHPPGEYRVNGILRHVDGWYEAFDVGPSHALYLPPEDRISLW